MNVQINSVSDSSAEGSSTQSESSGGAMDNKAEVIFLIYKMLQSLKGFDGVVESLQQAVVSLCFTFDRY